MAARVDGPVKLLWLTKIYPYPALSGDAIYSRHLIEGCARLGAQIHVLCHPGLGGDHPGPPHISSLSFQVLDSQQVGTVAGLLSVAPYHSARFAGRDRARATLVALNRQDWDCVVFDGIGALGLFDLVHSELGARHKRPKLVYLSHNHEETTRRSVARETRHPLKKVLQYIDTIKTGRIERCAVRHCDLLSVNTDEDWALYAHDNPDATHVTIRPAYDGPRSAKRSLATVPRTAIVLGSYQWVAEQLNLEALLEAAGKVFPAAGICLRVVGYMDEEYRRYLEASYPWAQIVGPVESVDAELAKARIGIVPEQAGGGFKHKLLNYIFSRLPIAALKVAVAGVPLQSGRHYLAAGSMAELVDLIRANINSSQMLEAMANEAYAICEREFSWEDRARRLLEAMETVKIGSGP